MASVDHYIHVPKVQTHPLLMLVLRWLLRIWWGRHSGTRWAISRHRPTRGRRHPGPWRGRARHPGSRRGGRPTHHLRRGPRHSGSLSILRGRLDLVRPRGTRTWPGPRRSKLPRWRWAPLHLEPGHRLPTRRPDHRRRRIIHRRPRYLRLHHPGRRPTNTPNWSSQTGLSLDKGSGRDASTGGPTETRPGHGGGSGGFGT